MKLHLILLSAAALAAPIAAHAQTADTEVNPPAASAPAMPAPAASATQAGVPASSVSDSAAPLGSPANPIPQSSPTPVDQASSLTAGDATVVSNGPVPDTPANRAKYGKPMSHAGRMTQAAGN